MLQLALQTFALWAHVEPNSETQLSIQLLQSILSLFQFHIIQPIQSCTTLQTFVIPAPHTKNIPLFDFLCKLAVDFQEGLLCMFYVLI